MKAASSAGRTVGVLILAQMVGGVLVNFVLTAPRLALVPRALATFGLAAFMLQLIANGLREPASA